MFQLLPVEASFSSKCCEKICLHIKLFGEQTQSSILQGIHQSFDPMTDSLHCENIQRDSCDTVDYWWFELFDANGLNKNCYSPGPFNLFPTMSTSSLQFSTKAVLQTLQHWGDGLYVMSVAFSVYMSKQSPVNLAMTTLQHHPYYYHYFSNVLLPR